MDNIIKTSPLFYNCAFHVITPYLAAYISPNVVNTPDFQFREVNPTAAQTLAFNQTDGYRYFCEAFSEYYHLQDKRDVVEKIKALSEKYSHPLDLQVLLGPVLRVTLGKVLRNNAAHKESLKQSFSRLITKCKDRLDQENHIYELYSAERIQSVLSNICFGKDEHEELFKPNIAQIAQVILANNSTEIDSVWGLAYENYCKYLADTTVCSYVSEDQLTLLCHSFNFRFSYNGKELTMPGNAASFTLGDVHAKLNQSQGHWEIVNKSNSNWNQDLESVGLKSIFSRYHEIGISLLSTGFRDKIGIIQNTFRDIINHVLTRGVEHSEESYTILPANDWANNSGLDQLSKLIASVAVGEKQLTMKSATGQIIRFVDTIGFNEFLTAFRDYYQIHETTTNENILSTLKRLCLVYPLHQERLMIIGPVLRKMLNQDSNAMVTLEFLQSLHLYFGIGLDVFADMQSEKVTCYDKLINTNPPNGAFETFLFLQRETAWHPIELAKSEEFEFSNALKKYSSNFAFDDKITVTSVRLNTLREGISKYLETGILYVETQRHLNTALFNETQPELLRAIRSRNANKVNDLLKEGINWRSQVISLKPNPNRVLSISQVPNKISYLEFAACYGDREIVTLILQHTTPSTDQKLVQSAYDGACNFKRLDVLPAFLSHNIKHSHQALINAVQEKDLALYQTFSDLGAPVFPNLAQNAEMMKYLYDHWMREANELEFNRAFQELCLLTFYKQKQSSPGVKSSAFEFNADVFQVFDNAYENNAVVWMNHFIQTMIKINADHTFQAEQAKAVNSSIGNLLERIAIKACLAITNEDHSELEKCFKISEYFIRVNGSNNIWHHAFQLGRMTLITKAYISYLYTTCGLIKGNESALDIVNFDDVNSSLMKISKEAVDKFGRTLAFREERLNLGRQLDARVEAAVNLTDRIKAIASQLKYRADNAAIALSDKIHERAVQASNVQSTFTYRTLYVGQQLIRTIPNLISHGPLRVGMSLVGLFLSNEARKRILKKATQYSGDYAAPLIGWDRLTAERIIPTVAENVFYLIDNPTYYMVSTGLSLSCYQGFKDSGHTSLEALAQCTLDSISYNLVAGSESNLVVDERFLRRLNNNLTPFIGQTLTPWVVPGVAFVQNAANQWNRIVNYPVNTLKPYVTPENISLLYQSLVASYPALANIPLSRESIGSIINPGLSFTRDTGTQLNEAFQSSISQLSSYLDTLSPGDVNISLNPEFRAKVAPLVNALDAISTGSQWFFEQSRDIVNQTPMYQEYFLNLIEKSILSTLTDSVFKSERLHAHQMFETHCINLSVAQLKNELNEATERGDSLAIEVAKTALDNQNVLLTEAKAKEEALFKETQGCKYFETWQDKYLTLKNKEFDKLLSPVQIEAIRAEERQARADSLLYNSDLVNHFGDEWSSAVDGIFDKNADNFTDNTNWVGVIKGIYQDAFAKFTNRDQIAEYISNEIIRRKYPLYPDVGDKAAIEIERDEYRSNVYDHKLDGFDGGKRQRHRCHKRLYDYIESAIGNTPEKQHVHRWNRMYTHFEQKFWKPLANEFACVFTLGNWHPYKRYPVGFNRGGGSGGSIFVNFNYNTGGSGSGFKIHTSSGGTQFTIYDSNRKSQSEFTLPEFKKNIEVMAEPKNVARGSQPLALPSAQMGTAHSRTVSDNPAMSLDNPIIQSILEGQYKDVFESGQSEAEARNIKPAQHGKGKTKPLLTPVRRSPRLAAQGGSPTPKAVSKPIPQFEHNRSQDLAANTLEKVLVGSGRAFVKTGQGIKQLGLIAGEKMGFVDEGASAEYTQTINAEAQLYDSTPVGESKIAKSAEIATDILLAVAVPEATGAKGAKYIVSMGASGAMLGAVRPTEEETLTSHAKNAAVDAAAAVVGGLAVRKAAQGIHSAFDKFKSSKEVSDFSQKLLSTSSQKSSKSANTVSSQYNLRPRTSSQNSSKNLIGSASNESSSFLPQRSLPEGMPSYSNYQRQTGGKNNDIPHGASLKELLASEVEAVKMYDQIRKNSADVMLIATNTGLPAHQINRIKNHLFIKTHQLRDRIDRFDPDFNTALAWKRLESGTFNDLDLKLLKHEHFESRFEGIFHTNYDAAHEAANRSGRFSGQKVDEATKYIENPKKQGRFDKIGGQNGIVRSTRKNRSN